MFTKANGIVDAYRWIPWISRETPFDRPNHGDPFVTAGQPVVKVTVQTDRRLVIASTADRVSISPDGLTQVVRRANVRDVVDHRRARLPDTLGARRLDAGPLLLPLRRRTPR